MLSRVSAAMRTDWRLSTGMVVAANAATILAFLESTQLVLVPFWILKSVFVCGIGVLAIGYLAGFLYFLARERSISPTRRRPRWLSTATLSAAPIALIANFALVPAPNPYPRIARQVEVWSSDLAATQHGASGGFCVAVLDPSARVQPWTTAQALVALLARPATPIGADDVDRAIRYLEGSRSAAIGGWGLWPDSPRPLVEVDSWVTIAYLRRLGGVVPLSPQMHSQLARAVERNVAELVGRQSASGGWAPVPQAGDDDARVYSTAMALWALVEALESREVALADRAAALDSAKRAAQWLLNARNESVGWYPNPQRRQPGSFPGLTAQVLFVLDRAKGQVSFLRTSSVLAESAAAFASRGDLVGRELIDNERLPDFDQHLVTIEHQLEGSTYLWFPWTVLALDRLRSDVELTPAVREGAEKRLLDLLERVDEIVEHVGQGGTYELAEYLLALSEIGSSSTWPRGSVDV